MSSWIYRKPEEPTTRGLCVLCEKNLQKKTSRGRYQSLCSSCDDRRFKIKKRKGKHPYRRYKKLICNRCGFVPEHRCQLDIHHVDGNHHNNDPNNLETLCANCHRLEHKKTPDLP